MAQQRRRKKIRCKGRRDGVRQTNRQEMRGRREGGNRVERGGWGWRWGDEGHQMWNGMMNAKTEVREAETPAWGEGRGKAMQIRKQRKW